VTSTQAHVDQLSLIDHHCHAVLTEPLERERFERWITESDQAMTQTFDTPLGLAILAWCAPVLDLPPHAEPHEYVERRLELGAAEACRRILAAADVDTLIVDTGIEGAGLCSIGELSDLAGAPVHEVIRVEATAARAARAAASGAEYADRFMELLEAESGQAVALKSIAAYRGGLALDSARPRSGEVSEAADRWMSSDEGRDRLTDPLLVRFGLWAGVDVAARRGLPIQIHTGLGDTDLDLLQANPLLLTPMIRALGPIGVDVTLLHGYPYHREAAYLAAMFPNVYLDVGLALTHGAGGAARILGEIMEVAPFNKQLYSSDAIALAELHYLGALLFRRALANVLDGWIAGGLADETQARRVATAIASENARRLYSIG
jgi:predicted TIM-barrel fold metal-dependent hydrolase